jgi:glutamate racemase
VENKEAESPGADYFVKAKLDQLMELDPLIDAVILGCTHYPLLLPTIMRHVRPGVRIIPQGDYVAKSLEDYLYRHPEMEQKCRQGGHVRYLTTENTERFEDSAWIFLHEKAQVEHVDL